MVRIYPCMHWPAGLVNRLPDIRIEEKTANATYSGIVECTYVYLDHLPQLLKIRNLDKTCLKLPYSLVWRDSLVAIYVQSNVYLVNLKVNQQSECFNWSFKKRLITVEPRIDDSWKKIPFIGNEESKAQLLQDQHFSRRLWSFYRSQSSEIISIKIPLYVYL